MIKEQKKIIQEIKEVSSNLKQENLRIQKVFEKSLAEKEVLQDETKLLRWFDDSSLWW